MNPWQLLPALPEMLPAPIMTLSKTCVLEKDPY